MFEAWAVGGVFVGQRGVNGHGFLLAFDLHTIQLQPFEGFDGLLTGVLTDHNIDPINPRQGFQTRPQVHCITNHSVGFSGVRPHVPHVHGAGVQTNANPNLGQSFFAMFLVDDLDRFHHV